MKKITALDDRLLPIGLEEKPNVIPTRREILRMIGNIKAETADNARRTLRIISKLNDKSPELVFETDDISYLLKTFEANPMNLTAWIQGQMLDMIESAEPVKTV
jgi:hypothetical protein